METYLIYATESQYKGEHGIFDVDVVEAKDFKEAQDIGIEMSISLMESYSFLTEDIENEAYNMVIERYPSAQYNFSSYENEWQEIVDELKADNIDFEIWKLDPKGRSLRELSDMAYDDYEAVVSEYSVG